MKTSNESKQQIQKFLDNANVGIAITKDDHIVFANQALVHIFGFNNAAELLRKPILEYLNTPSRKQYINLYH